MAIYETIDRKRQDATSRDLKGKSHSMEALETPEPSLKSFDANIVDGDGKMVSETSNNRRRHRFVDLYELDRILKTKEVLLYWIAPITYQMYTLTFSNSPIKSAAILQLRTHGALFYRNLLCFQKSKLIFFRSKPHSSSSATRHLSSKENRRSIHETTSNRTTSTTTAAASATTTANNAQHRHNNTNNINNGNGNSNATVAKVTKSNPAKIVTSSSEPVRDLVRLRQGHCLWRQNWQSNRL